MADASMVRFYGEDVEVRADGVLPPCRPLIPPSPSSLHPLHHLLPSVPCIPPSSVPPASLLSPPVPLYVPSLLTLLGCLLPQFPPVYLSPWGEAASGCQGPP